MLVLFLVIPVLSIILLFVKESNQKRNLILNIIAIVNLLVYIFPVSYAFLATLPDGNMWSENGPGAILWLYFLIFPVCVITFLTVTILKIVYSTRNRKTSG